LENRGLLEIVIVANEAIDEAKRNKKPCVVFKVDFEKAYDMID